MFKLLSFLALSILISHCSGGKKPEVEEDSSSIVEEIDVSDFDVNNIKDIRLVVGKKLNPMRIKASGMNLSCVISPDLPRGLVLNKDICELSGTPLEASSIKLYKLTVKGENDFKGEVSFNLEVLSEDKASKDPILSSISDKVFEIGKEISPIVVVNTGASISSCMLIPSTPFGLSINNSTCEISGRPEEEVKKSYYTIDARSKEGKASVSFYMTINKASGVNGQNGQGGSSSGGGGSNEKGNEENPPVIVDITPPLKPVISINDGEIATRFKEVSISLGIEGNEVSDIYEVKISSEGCNDLDTAWSPYIATRLYDLKNLNTLNEIWISYRDSSLNESECVKGSITHDNTPPSSASISINSGDIFTLIPEVSLSLFASGASSMKIGQEQNCSDGEWEEYFFTKSYTLTSLNATNSVYVKYKDSLGNESECVSSSIVHNSQTPINSSVSINGGDLYTSSLNISLSLSSTYAHEMYVTNTAGCASGGAWETYISEKNVTLEKSNDLNFIYVKYRNEYEVEGDCVSASITNDNISPSDHSISINSGSIYTNSLTASLTLSASGASEMYVTNTAGCDSGGSWESYDTSKSYYSLTSENATNSVYVKFRDLALNESSCINDSIIHDNTAPTSTSISINSGSSHTNSLSASLTLSALGASEMYVTDTAGCGSGGSWEAYNTSKSHTLSSSNATNTVYVKYRDISGNESSCASDSIIHDSTAPMSTSISINSGVSHTNSLSASLTLSALGASEMYVTDTAGCGSDGSWEAYNTSKSHILTSSNATNTVYVKFRDDVGNESSCVNDSIIHDDIAPASTSISINSGSSHTNSLSASLTLSALGASEMYITNTAGCGSGGSWESYDTSKSYSLTSENATNSVYVKFRDSALNESSCVSDSIIHDSTAPTSTSISINSGSSHTNSLSASLTLVALGASEMYVTDTAGCGSGGSWEAYNTSKSHTLTSFNATNTVYVKYRDISGNESSCVSDSIIHDNTAPTSTSISINSGSSHTNSLSASLTLAALGASEMYVTNTAGCGSGGSWEAYNTSKSHTLSSSNATNTVYVKFRDIAGNESSCVSDSIIHDSTAPTSTSISINFDASYTNSLSASLTLSALGASEMYVTNTAGCGSGGSWEAYNTSKSHILTSSNATNTVYVKFRDIAGNESSCVSDSIIHDNAPPSSTSISINSGASHTNSLSASLTLSALGASEMYVTNTAGCGSGGSWESYNTSKSHTLSSSNATNTVYVKFRDDAGNESSCVSDSIIHDNMAPSSTSININSGASHTNSLSASLTLSALGANEMYVTNTAGCGSDGSWEAYNTSKSYFLTSENATNTVYVKFRDDVGNESSCVSDSIIHDDIAPASTSISINSGSSHTNSLSSTLTLSASGASEMYVTNTAGCGSGGSWEAYNTSKSHTLSSSNATNTVYVKFRDDTGNESSCVSDSIIHDNAPPSSTSISINSGASHTNSLSVSLTLSALGASEMYVTNTAGCGSGGSWESYNTSKSHTLSSSNATNTVYVKFRDDAGNESSCVNDSIIHDNISPSSTSISINSNATQTANVMVTLSISASGASEMYVTNTAECGSDGLWETYSTSKSYSLPSENTTNTVYVKFRDIAGNESSCVSDSIIHDNAPPSSTSISINSGASYTSSTSSTLSLSASGASQMYITNTAGCGSGGSWVSYSTSRSHTLPSTNSTNTVYVKFRDSYDNQSSCISDSIIHDDIAPTSTSISINSGSSHTNSLSSTLTLSALGASEMYVTNTSGCGSGGGWEAYSTTKARTLSTSNTTNTVYVRFRDEALNTSSCINDTIIHDNIAPSSTSISINAGSTHTASLSSTLTLSASGASEMYITNTAGCGSGGSWVSYSSSISHDLLSENATNTVYIKYRDLALNESSCTSDSIIHTTIAPVIADISPQLYGVGQPVSLVFTSSNSTPLSSCAVSPSLPSGLTLNTSSCSISGSVSSIFSTLSFTVSAIGANGMTAMDKNFTMESNIFMTQRVRYNSSFDCDYESQYSYIFNNVYTNWSGSYSQESCTPSNSFFSSNKKTYSLYNNYIIKNNSLKYVTTGGGEINSNISKVVDNPKGFAVLHSNGSVTTNDLGVFNNLNDFIEVKYFSTTKSVILKADGSVVSIGDDADYSYASHLIDSNVVKVFLNAYAFAAIKDDGSVVTWGDPIYGGDSSSVSSLLTSGVVNVYNTNYAFAALKTDGSVVTWGDSSWGGNSSSVSSSLSSGVVSITSNQYAFAALKSNGSVVTWGDFFSGGNSSSVSSFLSSGVVSIASTSEAFAALKTDGSVVTWGYYNSGGDSSSVSSFLSSGVVSITSNKYAFAALKTDGSVVTWGYSVYGGSSSSVSSSLSSGVVSIASTSEAFAALKSNGSVVTWGSSVYGGNSSSVSSSLSSGVVSITSNNYAFAALKSNGSVVTWGSSTYGGSDSSSSLLSSGVSSIVSNPSSFAYLKNDGRYITSANINTLSSPDFASIHPLNNGFIAKKINGEALIIGSTWYRDNTDTLSLLSNGVVNIFSNVLSFAALKTDGSVVTWGHSLYGGNSSSVSSSLSSGVVSIIGNTYAFAALKSNGSVVTWGDSSWGGNSSSVSSSLSSGVVSIIGNTYAFAALKSNGSVVTWGGSSYGGSSSSVSSSLSSGVVSITPSADGFAALKNDGSVVIWGSSYATNYSSHTSNLSSGVTNVVSYGLNFAALKSDGSYFGWGSVGTTLRTGGAKLIKNDGAVAILKTNGSVDAFGSSSTYGSSAPSSLSSNVIEIYASKSAFAALKTDGSVVTWGDSSYGGNSSSVSSFLSSGVVKIIPLNRNFIAVKADGSYVVWGYTPFNSIINTMLSP